MSTVATDFAADDSSLTAWTSGTGASPVTFVLGLNQSIILSKIILTFQGIPTFLNATLQFLNEETSMWLDLQYYAVNCSASFGMAEDAE